MPKVRPEGWRGVMDRFDYVIVGAGSAGCVLADRLSAGNRRVLVLEAGPRDRSAWIKLPIGYGKCFHHPRINWRLQTRPEPGLDDREIYWPRGKVVGGSSSINGLVYLRGLPHDFDDWARAGNPGWGWEDVVPVFDRIEGHVAPEGSPCGPGPLAVSDREAEYHPIKRHYLAAAEEAGLPRACPDRAGWGEGVAGYRITTRNGFRCSAADAFLRPALSRPSTEVQSDAVVDQILFEGRRATGVRYRCRGQIREARAERAVLLCAGAVHSPLILQASGIGPGDLLRSLGIAVREANEAVGGGLQDHLGIDYLFRATEATLNQELGTLLGQIRAAWQFLSRRGGPLSLSVNQMGGLVRSSDCQPVADLQLYCNPLTYTTRYRNRRPLLRPDPWPGFAIGFNTCRPTSTGRVDLSGPSVSDPPAIRPAYLSTNEDVASVLSGARLIERLITTRALQGLIAGANGFSPQGAEDGAILADFRARASTVFHACGTCRMAPRDRGGVVDTALRVHGFDGLRVIDASIFPNITSGNTNAPTIMVASKAADMILSEERG